MDKDLSNVKYKDRLVSELVEARKIIEDLRSTITKYKESLNDYERFINFVVEKLELAYMSEDCLVLDDTEEIVTVLKYRYSELCNIKLCALVNEERALKEVNENGK